MLRMVSHTSVMPTGGYMPYPMHSMWLMALKRAYEYCCPHVSFCGREGQREGERLSESREKRKEVDMLILDILEMLALVQCG